MEEINQKKINELAAGYDEAKWIIELLDSNMSMAEKANSKYKVLDPNGTPVGTMTPKKDCNTYYYDLHVATASYSVDGEIKQNGVCRIRILDDRFKDYVFALTFMATRHGYTVKSVEIFNTEEQVIRLSWCTWGQEGFEISNPYASVKHGISTEYCQKCKYPEGNSVETHVKPSLVHRFKLVLFETTEEEIKSMKKTPSKIFDPCEILEVKQTLKTHVKKYIDGCTMEEYVSNDALGIGLLSQFDCLYSQLPFTKTLKEIIGEELIVSSGLSLLFKTVDKEKEEGPEQKMKKLDAIV